MKKRELQKKAWLTAAAWLATDCDRGDLASDLTEAEEEYQREYIRNVIVLTLEKRGK
jgi:hypothetical protein